MAYNSQIVVDDEYKLIVALMMWIQGLLILCQKQKRLTSL